LGVIFRAVSEARNPRKLKLYK